MDRYSNCIRSIITTWAALPTKAKASLLYRKSWKRNEKSGWSDRKESDGGLLIHNHPELMIEWDWEARGIWKREGCRCSQAPAGASRNESNSVPCLTHTHTHKHSCMHAHKHKHTHTHTDYPNMKTSLIENGFSFTQHSDHIRQYFFLV